MLKLSVCFYSILYHAFCQIVTGYGTQSLGLELCLLAAYTSNKNFMGETVVGGAYSSARQASGCPRALAPGRGQPHPNLAPKLMTTCNPVQYRILGWFLCGAIERLTGGVHCSIPTTTLCTTNTLGIRMKTAVARMYDWVLLLHIHISKPWNS